MVRVGWVRARNNDPADEENPPMLRLQFVLNPNHGELTRTDLLMLQMTETLEKRGLSDWVNELEKRHLQYRDRVISLGDETSIALRRGGLQQQQQQQKMGDSPSTGGAEPNRKASAVSFGSGASMGVQQASTQGGILSATNNKPRLSTSAFQKSKDPQKKKHRPKNKDYWQLSVEVQPLEFCNKL